MLKHALTICTLVALPVAAGAQTTTTTTSTASTPTTTTTTATTTTTTVPMDKLVDKYATLAGSKDNAKKLVTGLRDGSDIKLGSETIKTPTDKMGVGNVNIALALTEASLDKQGIEKPTAKQLNTALTEILQQRADGKGWGQIAHSMDLKLGDVMRSENSHRPDRAAHEDRRGPNRGPERVAREDRQGPNRGPERLERQERFEKPERFVKPERPERPERHGR